MVTTLSNGVKVGGPCKCVECGGEGGNTVRWGGWRGGGWGYSVLFCMFHDELVSRCSTLLWSSSLGFTSRWTPMPLATWSEHSTVNQMFQAPKTPCHTKTIPKRVYDYEVRSHRKSTRLGGGRFGFAKLDPSPLRPPPSMECPSEHPSCVSFSGSQDLVKGCQRNLFLENTAVS